MYVCVSYIQLNSSKQVSENSHSLLPHPKESTYLCRSSNDVASAQASTAVAMDVVNCVPNRGVVTLKSIILLRSFAVLTLTETAPPPPLCFQQ